MKQELLCDDERCGHAESDHEEGLFWKRGKCTAVIKGSIVLEAIGHVQGMPKLEYCPCQKFFVIMKPREK